MQEWTETANQPLSPWWRHGTLLVMIFGFSVGSASQLSSKLL